MVNRPLIRSVRGERQVLSGDTTWEYVNVPRLFVFVEESIRGHAVGVFETNDEPLPAEPRPQPRPRLHALLASVLVARSKGVIASHSGNPPRFLRDFRRGSRSTWCGGGDAWPI
jgi:hypothetical protein